MKVKDLTRKIGYIGIYIKYIAIYPFARLLLRNRNIYLFSERGTDARDNGYYMFKYYKEVHPELESYYVIDKNSIDVTKIAKFGNIIQYRSIKHYILFASSKYKISTHVMGNSPNMYLFSRYYKFFPLFGNFVFLQHGVIKDDLPSLYRENVNINIFICGAKPEYEYVSETFHYMNGEVKYTGLARYDGLHNITTKRQILVMPTWRLELKFSTFKDVKESEYVKSWNEFLRSPRLGKFAIDNDVDIVFYPHYEMQKYLSLFNSPSNRVKIASFDKYDVQELLKESLLLITDYSSVYFDFAYMKKPCIYYQFDRDDFFEKHYAKGYYDYDTMGFGPVVKNCEELIDAVVTASNHSYKLDDMYEDRIKGFFPLHDNKNCERIFNEIERL